MSPAEPVVPTPCFLFARGPWGRRAPGLPCALVLMRVRVDGHDSGADCVAGAMMLISTCCLSVWIRMPPRHCERSEAIQSLAHDSGLLRCARNDGDWGEQGASHSAVILRGGRRSQYAEAVIVEPRGRGVMDSQLRCARNDGDWGEQGAAHSAVILRGGGGSSTPRRSLSSREAAAYWIPRLRGE